MFIFKERILFFMEERRADGMLHLPSVPDLLEANLDVSFIQDDTESDSNDSLRKMISMRALKKLYPNSFWGKLGECIDHSKTEYFTKPKEYCNVALDPTNVIHTVSYVSG